MVNPESPVINDPFNGGDLRPTVKTIPRQTLKAYVPPLPADALEIAKEIYAKEKELNSHLSLSELIAYLFEDADQLLELERESVCVQYFGFPIIQHNILLVEFYTGLPEAAQFCYVSSMLQRTIFRDYVKWDVHEKHGFMTHSMMTLMKLRLGMTDEELAERFQVEKHVVNMTMRLWIPALYKHIYQACEDLYRYAAPYNNELFTKVIDIVEVCLETPEFTRVRRGGRNQTRRAVLGVRSDGYVCFASDVFSEHTPEDVCIQRSKFIDFTVHEDVVLAHPEHKSVVRSIGIPCLDITEDVAMMVQSAADRIANFKILSAIPTEYACLASEIYKTCAALSNFMLPSPDDE